MTATSLVTLGLVLGAALVSADPCDNVVFKVNSWTEGWQADLRVPITQSLQNWTVTVVFNVPVTTLEVYQAVSTSTDNKIFKWYSYSWNAVQTAGSTLVIGFLARFPTTTTPPYVTSILFNGAQLCSGAAVITTSKPASTNSVVTTTVKPANTTTVKPTTSASTTKAVVTTTTPVGTTTKLTTTRTTTKPTTSSTTTKPTTTRAATTKPTTTSSTTTKPTTTRATTTTSKPAITTKPTTTNATTTKPTTSSAATTSKPATTTIASLGTKYNYAEVITKSLLFYAAQRSGKLPADNPIPYRKDSALNDKGLNGEDLTGGYYDAGDHVKFGFPMAGMTTIVAWSLIDYFDGYASAGQQTNAYQMLKWSTDYFIKAHVAPNTFYGQVGDGYADHSYWGRPEEMTMARPAAYIDPTKPGSDLAGETAAALAAASIVFSKVNATYSSLCLTHAQQLYTFAKQYQGAYHNSITNAADFYKSWSGYGDELAWAAAWLYRATNNSAYLWDATTHYNTFGLSYRPDSFDWDNKVAGVQVLLAKLTGQTAYRQAAQSFCDYMATQKQKTPLGLVYISQWGSLRHASNVAFACLQTADLNINSLTYRQFAQKQIHYALGDTGKSYVVGFGTNPPTRPHHRSSSCYNQPSVCDSNNLNNPGANPQTLWGALVGGPDANDAYADVRTDYVKNEVACDYNAGFQAAVAALQSLALRNVFK